MRMSCGVTEKFLPPLPHTYTSKQPLVLMEVTTACGCTKVEWQKKPIPPHDSAELRIAFTAEQEGAFFKKIAVRHSAAKHPVSFLIEGIVTNLPTN